MRKDEKEAANSVVNFFANRVEIVTLFLEGRYRLVAVGNDMFSAYTAADRYHYLKAKGETPVVDCLDWGSSRRLNPMLHGKRVSNLFYLKYTLLRLGVHEKDIGFLVEGYDMLDALRAYKMRLWDSGSDNVVFCPVKRQAPEIFLTQQKAEPSLRASYFFFHQTPEEQCYLYNGMALADGKGWLVEIARLLRVYFHQAHPSSGAPVLMKKLELPVMLEGFAKALARKYGTSWQRFLVCCSYIRNIGKIRKDYLFQLYRWQDALIEKYSLERVLKWDSLLETASDSL